VDELRNYLESRGYSLRKKKDGHRPAGV